MAERVLNATGVVLGYFAADNAFIFEHACGYVLRLPGLRALLLGPWRPKPLR